MVSKILKFSAEWCSPCQALKKNLKDLDFPIEEIDVDRDTVMVDKYSIMAVPTLIYLDEDENILHRSTGLVTKDVVLAKIEELNEAPGD